MKNTKTVSLSLRKLVLSVLVTAPLATLPVPLWGLPSDAASLATQVSSTSSGVTVGWTSATRVDVTSTATNSVIKWVNFGATGMTINSGDTINYALPSSSSSVLNTITGTNSTLVNGTLSSNGNIYVLNPNGITIGSTGVITANGVGLSTVPETEYNFLTTGTLSGIENQGTTTGNVTVASGAMITAASGTGNVWIAAKGADVSGNVDAGAVTVNSVRGGPVTLGVNGDLIVGDASAHASTLTVNAGNVTTSTSGGITIGNATVYGGSVSLTTGNAAILGNGTLMIGAGSGTNATLTSNSGTADTTYNNVIVNGTGTLTVNASGGNVTVNSNSGKIAIGGNATGLFTAGASGDLTVGNTTASDFTGSSATGNIYAPGTVNLTATGGGNVTLTVAPGKDVAYTTKVAPATFNITAGNGTVGNVTLIQTTGNMTLPGNITAGSITATAQAGSLTLFGPETITNGASYTASKDVTLGQTISAGSVTANAGGNLTQSAAVTLGNATTGTVNYTAGGNGTVSITSTIGASKSVTISAGKNIGLDGAITTDSLSATSANGNVYGNSTINGVGNSTISLTATNGDVSTTGIIGGVNAVKSVTITAGNAVTIGANIFGNTTTATATNKDLTLAAALSDAVSTTLAATAGNVSLNSGSSIGSGSASITAGGKITDAGTISAGSKAVTLTAGGNVDISGDISAGSAKIQGVNLTQSAGNIIVGNTTTLVSSGNVSLTTAANDFGTVAIQGAPNGATIVDTNSVIVGNGTAATGNVTITGGNITLGSQGSDTISIAGNFTGNATAGNINDNSDNTLISGALKLTATGTVVLDGSAGTGIGLNNSYGQVNITAGGDAKVYENTTLNLGNITLNSGAGNITAYSGAGIINTGVLKVNNVLVGAGTASAPGDISLTSGNATIGNQIAGTITIQSDLGMLGSTSIGNYLANNLTVVNAVSNANLLTLPRNVYGNDAAVNVSLTSVGSAALGVGQLNTTGAVSLTADTGAITATNGNNTITNVTVQGNAAIDVSSLKDLTVNTTATGIGAAGNSTFTSTGGGITIGSFNSNATGATVFVGNKTVTDSVPGIHIYGPVSITGSSISLTNSGHSFGGVTLTTTGNGTASIVESGTLKLVGVNTGTGAFTATSSNGDIITDGASTGVKAGTVTATANNGSVSLSDGTNNAFGTIGLTAVGNSVVNNSGNTTLSAVTVSNGTFAMAVPSGKNITQKSGTSIYTYGATTFKTDGSGAITLTNSGNQFGGLTLGNAGVTGNISITEQTTMNLKSVTTSGKFTATSAGGDIIDSGALAATGTSILAAPNGNILLTKSSDFGTVSFNTPGNVSIKDANAILLDTSTIGGALTVTAGTSASQLGALSVGGNTSFTTGTTLTLNNTSNTFGAVRLNTAGDTLIDEATTFNLAAGSISTGAVTINTGGDFVTSGTGGSSFTGTGLTINATGTIIPSAGSLLVTGVFTVNSPSTKDLSALSKAGNLANHDPVNQGTGPYTGPNP